MSNVSIIIPAYNEELLLKTAVERTLQWARSHTDQAEVIIAENGSTDATARLADELAERNKEVVALHLPEANFGRAFRTALQQAHYDSTILLNADWVDPEFMTQSLPLLEVSDVVVGSKTLDPTADHRPLVRKLLSKLLTATIRIVFRFRGSDSHGLKALKTKAILPIVNDCQSLEIIETELLLRAQWSDLTIVEVPVSIEELRPPRLSVARRCLIVGRELWLLSYALRDIRHAREGRRASRG